MSRDCEKGGRRLLKNLSEKWDGDFFFFTPSTGIIPLYPFITGSCVIRTLFQALGKKKVESERGKRIMRWLIALLNMEALVIVYCYPAD